MNALIFLMNLIANILLLYALQSLRFLSNIMHRFVVSLVVGDIFVALAVQTSAAATLFMPHSDAIVDSACMVSICAESLAFLFCEFSAVLVMSIAIDRYLHIKHLQNYNIYMTPYRAKVMIVSAGVFSTVIAGIFFAASLYGFLFIYHTIVLLIDLPVIITSFVLYVRAFYLLRKRVSEMNLNATNMDTERSDLKFAKAVVFILVSVIVCYMPYFSLQTTWLYLHYIAKQTPNPSFQAAVYWSILLVHSSSLCNPIILLFSSSETSKLVRGLCARLIRVFCQREGPSDAIKPEGHSCSAVSLNDVVLRKMSYV